MVAYVLPIGQSVELQRKTLNAIFADIEGRLPLSGTGSPEGAVVADKGRLYLRTDGSTSTTLYVKTSGTGNTGWTAK